MTIQWHPLARMDPAEIVEFIAEDDRMAAERPIGKIEREAELPEQMPEMGRPGRRRGTRELVVPGTRYLLPYQLQKGEVLILRVLHGARRWPQRL